MENLAFNGGLWSILGDDLVQTTRATMQPIGPTLLFGERSWCSFDLEFNAMVYDGSEGFKALFRARSSQEMCGVGFGSYGNRYHDLWYLQGGKWSKCGDATAEGCIEYGRWYCILIRLREKHVSCFLDGVHVFEADYPDPFTSGLIGFSTWDSIVAFRNITVKSIDGKTMWSGLPLI